MTVKYLRKRQNSIFAKRRETLFTPNAHTRKYKLVILYTYFWRLPSTTYASFLANFFWRVLIGVPVVGFIAGNGASYSFRSVNVGRPGKYENCRHL